MGNYPKAHEDDILIIGFAWERQSYPEFHWRKVFTSDQLHAIQGRRWRNAYVTDFAAQQMHPSFSEILYRSSVIMGPNRGKVLPAREFRPFIPPTKLELLTKRIKGLGKGMVAR